ncbi:MAG TPA: cation-transporting P-type ATPase [Geobacteraceae bacterium]
MEETHHPHTDTPGVPVHTLPIQEVFRALGTSPRGLSRKEAEERLLHHGRNSIRVVKGKPLYLKFLANFTHLMAILLWVGGAMAFIGRMPQLGWAIWAVIVINAVFSFWQEYRAERAMEALRRLLPVQTLVLRDGVECRIPAEELVPGDVMLLAEGDHISADGRLVEEAELRVDQSTLSGESHSLRRTADAVLQEGLSRTELPNLVFAGTSVAAGVGKAVVFGTGMATEFGKIAHLTMAMTEELSPLQQEINRMTRLVTALVVVIGIIFFCLSVVVAHRPVHAGFIFAVGMVVAFVPEGLLPTVTLALAMGVQRMARRNALVKRLSSVETLGCCTVICTDKTGTLTQNEMTVRDLWVAGRRLSATGIGYAPEGEILDGGRPVASPLTGDLGRLLVAGGLCNDSRLIPPGEKDSAWTVLGDPTEAALRVAARKGGVDLAAEEARLPRLREFPFESRRKRMSTIHREGDGRVAFVKGAPREVIGLSGRIRQGGIDIPLSCDQKEKILAANDEYARNGLRVLAVAERTLPGELRDYAPESIEKGLTLLGLMAMMDPPRDEVAEAVAKCHRAGIRVIMITGDYGLTAESIARRIGIIREGRPRLVTGADLDAMDDGVLQEALAGEVIFARAAPEHKLRVVSALREAGHVVAVTGDGVNDAPALKRADIGVAMGIAGTDVAKEAADMVLTDDNFASIVNAIEEGRGVYANIKKFATYIFSHNMTEAWPFILQIMCNIPLALPVMQVLAIDLGTDIVPALALGTEKPEPGVMDRPPRSQREHLIDSQLLLRAMVWLGSLQTLLCFAGFFFLYRSFGYGDLLHLPRPDLLPYAERLLSRDGSVYVLATSMFLAGVVTTQVGNAYACRTERVSVFSVGFWSNRFLLFGFLVELTLVGILIYLPPFQSIFELGPLPLTYWLFLFIYPPVMFLAEEGRKAFLRRRDQKRGERISPQPGGTS